MNEVVCSKFLLVNDDGEVEPDTILTSNYSNPKIALQEYYENLSCIWGVGAGDWELAELKSYTELSTAMDEFKNEASQPYYNKYNGWMILSVWELQRSEDQLYQPKYWFATFINPYEEDSNLYYKYKRTAIGE